jgi:hypothetical protein
MDEKTRQQVREAIADHEAAHPHWREEARDRMIAEAQQAEARAHQAVQARQQEQQQLRQRVDANITQSWCNWIDERIAAHIKADSKAFVGAMGQVISEERQKHRRETKTAIDRSHACLSRSWRRWSSSGLLQSLGHCRQFFSRGFNIIEDAIARNRRLYIYPVSAKLQTFVPKIKEVEAAIGSARSKKAQAE